MKIDYSTERRRFVPRWRIRDLMPGWLWAVVLFAYLALGIAMELFPKTFHLPTL